MAHKRPNVVYDLRLQRFSFEDDSRRAAFFITNHWWWVDEERRAMNETTLVASLFRPTEQMIIQYEALFIYLQYIQYILVLFYKSRSAVEKPAGAHLALASNDKNHRV